MFLQSFRVDCALGLSFNNRDFVRWRIYSPFREYIALGYKLQWMEQYVVLANVNLSHEPDIYTLYLFIIFVGTSFGGSGLHEGNF